MHSHTCTHTHALTHMHSHTLHPTHACMYPRADVVRAYKSVLKEKEALEASIRAISSHTGGGISEGGGGEEGVGGGEGRPPEDVESGREVEVERRTDESETEEGQFSEVKLSPEPKQVVKVMPHSTSHVYQVMGEY